MSVVGNEEFTRSCFPLERLSFFLRLFYRNTRVGIVFSSAYLRLGWVGCASFPADPLLFDTSRTPAAPTCVLVPRCASGTRGKLGSFKLRWLHRSCHGNGAAPTGERVCALQEKFASGCAATLADQLCWRDLEDGTLQNLPGRPASEQRACSSLSHSCLPEKVSNTFVPARDCDVWCFVRCNYFWTSSSYIWCLAYTSSIHLLGPIVFLTVGFLFPVLAAHTLSGAHWHAHVVRARPASLCAAPGLCAACACSWACVPSNSVPSWSFFYMWQTGGHHEKNVLFGRGEVKERKGGWDGIWIEFSLWLTID